MSGKTSSYQLGVEAELLVALYFNSLGFTLISLRYKTKFGEIDLVLKQENQIVFVEVKTRSKKFPVEELITQRQIDRNYAAAEFFLAQLPEYSNYDCRFDVVILCNKKIIYHIQDII